MNVNSGLLTPNSHGISAPVDKKFVEIFPDDTKEEDQSDMEEEKEADDDDRSSTNLALSSVDLRKGQETLKIIVSTS